MDNKNQTKHVFQNKNLTFSIKKGKFFRMKSGLTVHCLNKSYYCGK